MSTPEKIKLSDHYKNDTWEGMIIGPVLINGAQPSQNIVSARMEFRDKDDQLGYALDTSPGAGEGTITIDDAATWEITVAPQLIPGVDAGVSSNGSSNTKIWYWDFETTDAAGVVLTLYRGTMKVKEDVTA
jgi:hypothetical protein